MPSTRHATPLLELLVRVRLEEGRALERHELGPDADGLEIVLHDLGEVRVGRVAVVVTGVEAVRVAGVGQELLRARRIVDGSRGLEIVLEIGGDDAVRELGVAERQRLVALSERGMITL